MCMLLSKNLFVGFVFLIYRSIASGEDGLRHLVSCSESRSFKKRQNDQNKEYQKRLRKFQPGTAPAISISISADRSKKRFEFYSRVGLLCGEEGLPHLIAEPGIALRFGHEGDVLIPTVIFLYFAGLIGFAGRLYLEATRDEIKEIIIDVPLAIESVFSSMS